MQGRSLILFAFAMLAAMPAAADFRAASEAFRAGHYDRAFAEAGGEQTAESHAFRARTLLAKAMCGDEDPPRSLIDQALSEAEIALSLEPDHLEGRLQKAISLSLILRPMSISEARKTGYGELSRTLAESVLEDAPGNFYAHGFLAVWHVEVERRGGMIGAAIMGASLKAARRHYEEAVRLAPADIGLRWQWARALAALDARKHQAEITLALEAAVGTAPATDLDKVMQARAARLLEVVARDKPRDVERLALAML
ncbi:hypothetical protein HNE_0547 [Hyphomonas neptunium ATCC 15444]|uniref:Tetratricopeptide repeat protein n=2 Tax=Hyphomonas TaxID=85 RepID=Q0C4R7_HYPNA|nr:hypothetical protein HNE_0547 [Hyphomonas neptunium ATCC 15444]KCZ96512.1 hypothetical protein HHI_02495 [Hyphomonas hirschiana VP5]